jgi:hypothetical protein
VLPADEKSQILAQPGQPMKKGRSGTMAHDHKCPATAVSPNAVEGRFGKSTSERLKLGVFRSTVKLQAAINHFFAETNANSRPFHWTRRPARFS